MRPDMSKVVTERPRSRSSDPSFKTALKIRPKDVKVIYDDNYGSEVDFGADYGQTRVGSYHAQARMFRSRDDCKSFSDLLGPLRGYLRKQVGRPWNKVFSELSANLDRRGTSGSHIWDHVMQEVSVNCYIGVDDRIYDRRYGWKADGLCVHPKTGILVWQPQTWRYRDKERWAAYALRDKLRPYGFEFRDEYEPRVIHRHGSYQPLKAALVVGDWVFVDGLTILQRIKGCWMVHKFQKLDPDEVVAKRELNGREIPVTRRETKEPLLRHLSVRQIGRREKSLWAMTKRAA